MVWILFSVNGNLSVPWSFRSTLTSRVQLSCLHKSTQCHPRCSSAAQGIPAKQMDGIGPTGKHFGASGAQEEYVQPFSWYVVLMCEQMSGSPGYIPCTTGPLGKVPAPGLSLPHLCRGGRCGTAGILLWYQIDWLHPGKACDWEGWQWLCSQPSSLSWAPEVTWSEYRHEDHITHGEL